MDAKKVWEEWCERLPEEDPLYPELLEIGNDEEELENRFGTEISFGTAGLRGIYGAGTACMNEYTVGRAAAGVADCILASGSDPEKGVVLAYDCRYHSRELAEYCAGIFTARGIRAFLFSSMRPTPELSFLIRRLGTVSGVNLTASHNPKEYNGFKVYWTDGAQISGAVSDAISKAISERDLLVRPDCLGLPEAERRGRLVRLGEKEDRMFYDYVLSMRMRPDEELDLTVPVVYTPLNGAGRRPVETVFGERGFTAFHVVPEQADPDPEFTTVGYPNPEVPAAFALAEALGKKTGAEVLIATDPDSDRMAIEIRDEKALPEAGAGTNGGYRFLNGNQTGALLIAYMAESLSAYGALPEKSALIQSIVTGSLGRTIAADYGIETFEALTGFKNICGRVPELLAAGYSYFFAYEESIGCAPGEAVRDKDGVTAAMLIAEMAAYYRKRGRTLADVLDALYRKYGYFSEEPVTLVLPGESGREDMQKIMEAFRQDPPDRIGGEPVEDVTDYKDGFEDIPPSNVLRFRLTGRDWFAVRPSGTEPKLKFYCYSVRSDEASSKAAAARIAEDVRRFAERALGEEK